MFDVYEVVAWWLFTPWVLLVLDFAFRRRKVETVTETVTVEKPISGRDLVELVKPYIAERQNVELALEREETKHAQDLEALSAALAEARESSAAHMEAVRKLEAEKAEVVKWKGLAEIWQGKAAKLHQKRGKDGKFQKKIGKAKKSVDYAGSRG